MIRERSIGTVLFGLFFLFASYYFAINSLGIVLSYAPTIKGNPPQMIYRALKTRMILIKKAEIDGRDRLLKSGKKSEFDQKFQAFKNDAESFKQKYIIQGNMLPNDQTVIFIGFLNCILYLIAGVGLLMHFFWARRVALVSTFTTFILYLAFLYQIYWVMHFSQVIVSKFDTLYLLINPKEACVLAHDQDAFKVVFLNPYPWIFLLIVLLYVFTVCFYFNRPKIKERFQ